tara:strand:- start:829 stop:1077 length:249 start_codon:yes stop_codon:yes gene_type:complete
VTKLEGQLAAASEAHRKDLAESCRAHREELDAFRLDYKEIETQARETAAGLSKAKEIIRQLRLETKTHLKILENEETSFLLH